MSEEIKKQIKNRVQRNYLARDFDGFRSELYRYAQTYFPEKIQDFSEASLGGLFLDMAAMIGDNLSFYMDHQFHEVNPLLATELDNIEMHAINAGVKIVGAAPAVSMVNFYIETPAIQKADGLYEPDPDLLPVIMENSVLISTAGVKFFLTEDLDFSAKKPSGDYLATSIPFQRPGEAPSLYTMILPGRCISGEVVTEKISVGNFKKFRRIKLKYPNVSTIIRVIDTEGNDFYEVESLSQDTVFNKIEDPDGEISGLEVIPAPYRYTVTTDIRTRSTTLSFGAGDAKSLKDELVPDPSDLALPLYGKKTFSEFSIDPSSLLRTKTLGIAPINTTLTITYRYGGGANHNVSAESIDSVSSLNIKFKDTANPTSATAVKNSIVVSNPLEASGGAPPQSITDIKQAIPSSRSMQNRIVTKEDLMARVYTLPNEFGRIFRAGISDNPNNNLASVLYIVSKDSSGNLVVSPDALKDNLSVYLNQFRLVGDALDILDARVLNYRIRADIVTAPNANKLDVISNVISDLKKVVAIENFQIGQPINESDLVYSIIGITGVLSLVSLSLENVNGKILDRSYSSEFVDMASIKAKGIYFAEPGDIFECRFPDHDIIINAQ
tara:strand:+ start:2967 stop:4796 length:1830 start_codon:yes stop_codon:yes gene_type:complete